MKSVVTNIYVLVTGLVMLLIGSYIALATPAYMAVMAPQDTPPSVNILSDLRGMGGVLIVLGSYVFASIFRETWRQSALVLATAVYATFVLFRSLGFVLDGLPDMGVLLAYFIEAVLTATGIYIGRGASSM